MIEEGEGRLLKLLIDVGRLMMVEDRCKVGDRQWLWC